MKKIFLYSQDNFEFLVNILPETNKLTYYFFSEIKQLKTAIKQLNPEALFLDVVEFNSEISACLDLIDNKTIIISRKLKSIPKKNKDIHFLPDELNKESVFNLFSKLNIIGQNISSLTGVQASNINKGPKNLSNQKLLELLMNNLPDAIYFKDRMSRYTKINEPEASILQINNPNEAIGKTDACFFDQALSEKILDEEQTLMESGIPLVNKLHRIKTITGERHALSTKVPLINEDHECIGLVGITRDITNEYLAKKELLAEKKLMDFMMNNVPDYIYFKDTNLKYIRVNKSIADVYKTDINEIIGKSDLDFFPKKIADKFHKQETEVIQNDVKIIDEVQKLKNSEGKTIWISSTKVPIKDEFSKIIGLAGISHDVTLVQQTKQYLEKAKAKAEEANRAKSLFLANMSHEIRTPMNGIIGMADILSKSQLDATQKEYLDIITKSGKTLLSLINNILDFSKIESGKMELETVPINIRSVIEEVADIHVVHATSKSIAILTYIDPEVPEYVGGDYVRLKQVITNLVNNAIKFTSEGEVVVNVSYVGIINGIHNIQFDVKDSGIGITEENQKKLFKSFSQVDASTTREFGGTGLGLAISQKLVALMGGELSLKSIPGSGSTFYFKAKFNTSVGVKSNKSFLSKKQLRGKHIVIVDDNETNRLIFKKYLEIWEVKVSEFKDAIEALSFLKNEYNSDNLIDLVLVDYHMPGMDGREFAQRIKKDERLSNLKLILLSSITDALSTSELKHIGFETGLNKPIKMNQLLNVTLKVFGVPQAKEVFKSEENDNHLLSLKNKEFLIVEDNLINIKVAEIVLRKLSNHVKVARNGLEAVNLFKENEFDVILMDIKMPVMDGVEATLKIRKLEKKLNTKDPVKIIATTANTFQEDVEICMDSGMDAFLEKPFKREDLLSILQQLM